MKLFKIVFSIIALFSLVTALVLAGLVTFIDPNKLKPVLIQEVKNRTGYELTIDGNLSWSFYPRIAIKIDHLTLNDSETNSVFFDAQDVRMAADLFELLQAKERLQGKVTIAALKFMNVKIQQVNADVHWQDNVLSLQPMSAALYEGTFQGEAAGSNLTSIPQWRWDIHTNGVRLQPLLEDANGKDNRIKIAGVGEVNLKAETRGMNREQLLSELQGKGSFSLNNGAVEGVDINYFIKSAEALISKKADAVPADTKQTPFTRLGGDFSIVDGVATTENAKLDATSFTANVEGSLAISSEQIDFGVKVAPTSGAPLKWQIPLSIVGTLHHPDVRLDSMAVQRFLVGKEINNLRDKVAEKIKDRIPGKAGEILQNLLGR